MHLDWALRRGHSGITGHFEVDTVEYTGGISKVEHIIDKHISEFLEEQYFFTKGQHGFRRVFSTQTQLVETIHDFAVSINNGIQTDAIFLDFPKAFDTVPHNKLLYKLN